jgi:diadenosine tetraphosphate (Ap4A) HIT family hydrolase
MTTRKRKEEIQYRQHRKRKPDAACEFCAIKAGDEQFIEEGKHFKVIINLFKYTFWDEQDVTHQVMLVPKMHTETISSLPVEAASEFLKFIGKYEAEGYNVYARARQNDTKSVPHQHTHLIKTKGKRKKVIIYSRKPFMLFMR